MKKILVIVFMNLLLIFMFDLIVGHQLLKSQNRQYYSGKKLQETVNSNRVSDGMYSHGFVPNTSIDYYWNNDRWYKLYINSLGLVDKSIKQISKSSEKKEFSFWATHILRG